MSVDKSVLIATINARALAGRDLREATRKVVYEAQRVVGAPIDDEDTVLMLSPLKVALEELDRATTAYLNVGGIID